MGKKKRNQKNSQPVQKKQEQKEEVQQAEKQVVKKEVNQEQPEGETPMPHDAENAFIEQSKKEGETVVDQGVVTEQQAQNADITQQTPVETPVQADQKLVQQAAQVEQPTRQQGDTDNANVQEVQQTKNQYAQQPQNATAQQGTIAQQDTQKQLLTTKQDATIQGASDQVQQNDIGIEKNEQKPEQKPEQTDEKLQTVEVTLKAQEVQQEHSQAKNQQIINENKEQNTENNAETEKVEESQKVEDIQKIDEKKSVQMIENIPVQTEKAYEVIQTPKEEPQLQLDQKKDEANQQKLEEDARQNGKILLEQKPANNQAQPVHEIKNSFESDDLQELKVDKSASFQVLKSYESDFTDNIEEPSLLSQSVQEPINQIKQSVHYQTIEPIENPKETIPDAKIQQVKQKQPSIQIKKKQSQIVYIPSSTYESSKQQSAFNEGYQSVYQPLTSLPQAKIQASQKQQNHISEPIIQNKSLNNNWNLPENFYSRTEKTSEQKINSKREQERMISQKKDKQTRQSEELKKHKQILEQAEKLEKEVKKNKPLKKLAISAVAAGIGLGGALATTSNKSVIAGASIFLFVASFILQK